MMMAHLRSTPLGLGLAFVLSLAGLALAGCSRPNLDHCLHKGCPGDMVCDPRGAGLCVPISKLDAGPDRRPTPDSDESDGSMTTNIDVLAPGDAPGPDAELDLKPEVPEVGECSDDKHCSPDRVCRENKCRTCGEAGKLSASCPRDLPYCSKAFECVSCNQAEMDSGGPVCAGATPFCNAERGNCVQCLEAKDCAMPGAPICSTDKTCVGCGSAMPPPPAPVEMACALKNPALPACKAADGSCVECVKHADCKANEKAACNSTSNKCEACTSDQQCIDRGMGPGLCLLDPDGKNGRCATEQESIYVMNKTPGCSDAGSNMGLAATPFCQPARAVMALSATRRLIILRGPDAMNGFTLDRVPNASTPVWVVGRGGAIINGGTGTGITIGPSQSDIRIRGLTIRGSEREGVRATGSATVRINRTVFMNNVIGGFRSEGAGFDIANSVFDRNGMTATPGSGAFGGALLQAPPGGSGRPSRFRLNTVVGNGVSGVTCQSELLLTGLLMSANSVVLCRLDATSKEGDPGFVDDQYHIGQNAPCRDAVPAGSAPADDFDGQPRDSDRTDCGADEWKP